MNYPTINIQGSIFLSDILDKIVAESEFKGQKAIDFDLSKKSSVKDEINRAWTSANALWVNFTYQKEKVKESETGTTQTRNSFVLPFLSLLGYNLEINRANVINDKSYAISHKDSDLIDFPVHIMGFNDSLDKKRLSGGPRMSPHALMQEYLNVTEHLYGLITNGNQLRLLRDSTRLISLSYLEFNLEQMFEENHFADFALLFRLLHSTRMPKDIDSAHESFIEAYHLDSLESGTRIRNGLSKAVEEALSLLAEGLLSNQANQELFKQIRESELTGDKFYQQLLDLVYKVLFLLVIEERKLIFPQETSKHLVDIYYNYYSLSSLRQKADRNFIEEQDNHDLWLGLLNTFSIFASSEKSHIMQIEPLGGDIFDNQAHSIFNQTIISNSALLGALRKLSYFFDEASKQRIRVNYGGLNVEEFGSVYEGLLEFTGEFNIDNIPLKFSLIKGSERSSSGSHYTPEELVKPLIDNSLEHIIADKLKTANPEQELLSITVCDVACGSGHILLNAARRIAYELAKIRSGEAQPTPENTRIALRDVISTCIYGVDLNPMAVKLCKIALWLEAHVPGQPLHFLANKIKCGNAIVGLALVSELEKGIADEAFKKVAGDNNDVCKELRDRNKKEKKNYSPSQITIFHQIDNIVSQFVSLNNMPEHSPEQIKQKKHQYEKIVNSPSWLDLKNLADIQTAQFFIPKTKENQKLFITDYEYRDYYQGKQMIGEAVAQAISLGQQKKFFHWFLEFPEIFAQGGFDTVLGNPPFLGGLRISSNLGHCFTSYIKNNFFPIGSVDLVTFFFRRAFNLIKKDSFISFISTNTIAQGETRKGGLAIIEKQGGNVIFAHRNKKWPGLAMVEVSLISICSGQWDRPIFLDNKLVEHISSYLDDSLLLEDPYKLEQNKNVSYMGSTILGDGFVLTKDEVIDITNRNPDNNDVIFKLLTGNDLMSTITQNATRWVINFFDWPLSRYSYKDWNILPTQERVSIEKNIASNISVIYTPPDYQSHVASDYAESLLVLDKYVRPEREKKNGSRRRKFWWQYSSIAMPLFKAKQSMSKLMALSQVSKYPIFSFIDSKYVCSNTTIIFLSDKLMDFVFLNSSFHTEWSWKNGSTMGSGSIRYIPTSITQTFPFPQQLSSEMESKLEAIGEKYYQHRQELMKALQLGLTKTYNQFHNPEVSEKALAKASEIEHDFGRMDNKLFIKKYKKGIYELVNHLQKSEKSCDLPTAVKGIIELRKLHKVMDELVLDAYGWSAQSGDDKAIDLAHDFYEVDYLPENDRVRYTISPDARKEVLERLLLLNHDIHKLEEEEGNLVFNELLPDYLQVKKSKKKRKDELDIEWE